MNRFLTGNFAPVDVELSAYALEVEGSVPTELEGRYVRTGPNPIHADEANHHWFIGNGMVHGVRLTAGKAEWYRNRYVTNAESAEYKGIADVPGPTNGFSGSGNTNVVHHAGRMVALTELTTPIEIDPQLETVARTDFGGPLPAGMTAHPKFDPDTGEMHAMAYSFVEPYLRYHVVDAEGALIRTEEIDIGGPVMVHDMGLTASSAIVFDLPVLFDMDMATSGRKLPYRWNDEYQARLGLVPRDGSSATQWIDIDPCYVFHPLNAYDEGDTIVIDVVRYDTMFKVELDGPIDTTQRLERWTIDRKAGKVLTDVISDRPQEFPRADERLATKQHRYGYTMGAVLAELGGETNAATAVLKHDLAEGTVVEQSMGAGRVAGEFVFVPAGEDAGEDEGWLMGYVYDAATDKSDLVILDAHDFGNGPVATVHLPVRVPAGFHGNWIPDAAIGR